MAMLRVVPTVFAMSGGRVAAQSVLGNVRKKKL